MTDSRDEEIARLKREMFFLKRDLRDYFAARAMQGVVVADAEQSCSDKAIAEDAYRMADAMLAAREATE